MSNNKISYLNRNFDDFKKSLTDYVRENYPQLANDFNDASIGSWLVDLMASIGDNLSFYIDKAYSETNLESAQRASSLYNLARNNGLKVPGPKGSIAEVEFSCIVPAAASGSTNSNSTLSVPVEGLLPVIKKGTKVASRNQVFEVMEDVDFASQFDSNGFPDRVEEPLNGGYRVTKKAIVTAGESKIYRQIIDAKDIVPFMEIVIPDKNAMSIESIILKDGTDFQSDPTVSEFMQPNEEKIDTGATTYRFFEVNSLVEQYRWGDSTDGEAQGSGYPWYYQTAEVGQSQTSVSIPVMAVYKGKWHGVSQKFITEFTDSGYLKVIFGSGEQVGEANDDVSDVAEYQMRKMLKNDFLGKLPKEGTLYILYRAGGGAASNVAAGTINTISYYNVSIGSCGDYTADVISRVKNSITVTNPKPSVSGKDAPTVDELRAMIKYNSGAQNRCVTLKDYENRVAMIPPRYGCPFRLSAVEENNKVMLYILGLDYEGKLSNVFPKQMIYNIMDYLSMYRSLNDFVEIKPGKVINLGFKITVFVDKNYVSADVAGNIIAKVTDYMDINRHRLGEDIFVGDLEKNISNVDGVLNLIEMKVYNKHGGNYSASKIAQPVIIDESNEDVVDLDASDYILNSDADSMFEIKFPSTDIKVVVRER